MFSLWIGFWEDTKKNWWEKWAAEHESEEFREWGDWNGAGSLYTLFWGAHVIVVIRPAKKLHFLNLKIVLFQIDLAS